MTFIAVLKRVLWGIGELIWPALGCALLAGLAYLVDGRELAELPDLTTVCLWYFGAALAAGVVLGLAKPLTASTFGLGVTGFLVAIPVSLSVLLLNPFARLKADPTNVGIALGIAAVFGPLTAAYVVTRNRQREAHDRDT